ncbi:MAG: murein DD-endopeptidase MepM/ murein hydrolase activator NlpD, partial [Candidatus Marinamargulisbacteria bacterium]
EKRRVERELISLSRKLRLTELRLKSAKKRLRGVQKKEEDTKQRLASLRTDFRTSKKKLGDRLVEIYKNQNLGVIELILSPKDVVSAIDSSYFFDRVIQSDMKFIEGLKGKFTRLQSERNKLKKHRNRVKNIKQDIASREIQLNRNKRKKQHYVGMLRSEIKKIEKQNSDLLKASNEIALLIRQKGRGKKIFYGTGEFLKPVLGWLSSKFGFRKHPIFKRKIRHTGIDLAAPKGYKIRAADSGVIIVAGRKAKYRGYGKVTVIDHGRRSKDGKRMSTVYAHQSRILVREGDFVKKGEEIGLVGATGYATGPHLHFEIRLDGMPVNPLHHLKL